MKHYFLSFAIVNDCVEKKSATNEFEKKKKEEKQIIWRWSKLNYTFMTYCKHEIIDFKKR